MTKPYLLTATPETYDEYVVWRTNNTQDSYSAGVVRYVERWAEQMQARIDVGSTVAEAAAATEHTADTEGITGFMYGCAVSALSKWWVHGESLRQWHNARYDKSGKANATSGAVVNPAVLTFGG